jgi:hypothetical protein
MNTVELARIYSAMQDILNIPLIFPIKDTASATLMLIKAECLQKAGVISEGKKQWVESRARIFLKRCDPQPERIAQQDEARVP